MLRIESHQKGLDELNMSTITQITSAPVGAPTTVAPKVETQPQAVVQKDTVEIKGDANAAPAVDPKKVRAYRFGGALLLGAACTVMGTAGAFASGVTGALGGAALIGTFALNEAMNKNASTKTAWVAAGVGAAIGAVTGFIPPPTHGFFSALLGPGVLNGIGGAICGLYLGSQYGEKAADGRLAGYFR